MYYTHTEDFIKHLFTTMDITSSETLSYVTIAQFLHIEVLLWAKPSMALFDNQQPYIMLCSQRTPQQQWQDFCHELCHVLLHEGGSQRKAMYPQWIEYQERKANYFMRHATVPTFMLDNYKELSVTSISEHFCVEHHLAHQRLNEYMLNKKFRNQWYFY